MMVFQEKIQMHMDAYRAQQQGYGHPLTITMSKKQRKTKNVANATPK